MTVIGLLGSSMFLDNLLRRLKVKRNNSDPPLDSGLFQALV